MPWLSVYHTRLCGVSAVPMPDFTLDVQRGAIPGHPGAKRSFESLTLWFSLYVDSLPDQALRHYKSRVFHQKFTAL